MVYLSTKRYKDYGSITYASKQTATVFEPRNLGPFSIIQKISSHAHKLKLPPSFRIHPVIHIRYLTKHNPTDKFSSREVIPPPETVINYIWKMVLLNLKLTPDPKSQSSQVRTWLTIGISHTLERL
jgi:hypothetical protein